LRFGPKGVEHRMRAIATGSVTMTEHLLPLFREVSFAVTLGDPNFAECCFAYALTCARAHGRVLAQEEADKLPNETYFHWYDQNLLRSPALKTRCRDAGFDVDREMAQRLTVDYLASLAAELARSSE
jgi:hypothetical protein